MDLHNQEIKEKRKIYGNKPQTIKKMAIGTYISDQIRSVAQSCPTFSNPMDCSLPGSSTHGIFQASVLEWVAIAFSYRYHTEVLILRKKYNTHRMSPYPSLDWYSFNFIMNTYKWYFLKFILYSLLEMYYSFILLFLLKYI